MSGAVQATQAAHVSQGQLATHLQQHAVHLALDFVALTLRLKICAWTWDMSNAGRDHGWAGRQQAGGQLPSAAVRLDQTEPRARRHQQSLARTHTSPEAREASRNNAEPQTRQLSSAWKKVAASAKSATMPATSSCRVAHG